MKPVGFAWVLFFFFFFGCNSCVLSKQACSNKDGCILLENDMIFNLCYFCCFGVGRVGQLTSAGPRCKCWGSNLPAGSRLQDPLQLLCKRSLRGETNRTRVCQHNYFLFPTYLLFFRLKGPHCSELCRSFVFRGKNKQVWNRTLGFVATEFGFQHTSQRVKVTDK